MGWGAGDAVTTRTPEVVARRNVIRHVDGAPDQAPLQNYSRGFYVSAIGALMVEENVVDLDITEPAIQYYDCRTNHFFANQSSAGALIQGYDAVQEATASELPLTVKDAEGLAL